jgi:hypothetical protein
MAMPGITFGVPSAKPFYTLRTDLKTGFPQEHVGE